MASRPVKSLPKSYTGYSHSASDFVSSPAGTPSRSSSAVAPSTTTVVPQRFDSTPSLAKIAFGLSSWSPQALPMPPIVQPEQPIPSPVFCRTSGNDGLDVDINKGSTDPQPRSWSPPPVPDSSQIQSATKAAAKLDAYSSTRRELLDILTSLHSTG